MKKMEKKHVLIVDDQKEILLLLSSALETLPYEFEISLARSGEEALLEASMNHADLLISDIILPGMDGFEVMENFKNHHPKCKIVLISGTQDESIKRQIAQAGATAFFFKPIVLSDFLDTIERTLGLVETLLPGEIESFKEDSKELEETETPPILISSLHNQIKADSIVLVNYKGEITCSIGGLSGEFKDINQNQELLSMLKNIVTVAQSFKTKVDNNFIFIKIHEKYVGLSAITTNYGLITLCSNQPSDQTIKAIYETQNNLRYQLSLNTDYLTLTNKAEQHKPPTEDLVDSRMEETLSTPKIKTDQLREFWEDAAKEVPITNDDQGLSYEQAKILGLTPEE